MVGTRAQSRQTGYPLSSASPSAPSTTSGQAEAPQPPLLASATNLAARTPLPSSRPLPTRTPLPSSRPVNKSPVSHGLPGRTPLLEGRPQRAPMGSSSDSGTEEDEGELRQCTRCKRYKTLKYFLSETRKHEGEFLTKECKDCRHSARNAHERRAWDREAKTPRGQKFCRSCSKHYTPGSEDELFIQCSTCRANQRLAAQGKAKTKHRGKSDELAPIAQTVTQEMERHAMERRATEQNEVQRQEMEEAANILLTMSKGQGVPAKRNHEGDHPEDPNPSMKKVRVKFLTHKSKPQGLEQSERLLTQTSQ